MNEHTVKAFDEDLNRLRGMVSEMGSRAALAVERAMAALNARDTAAAAAIVADDKRIDELEVEVEKLVVTTIALRAPMADDLRTMIAALKIAAVLERVGDYAKSIAKRVPLLTQDRAIDAIPLLMSMSAIVTEMLRDVLAAYAGRDAAKAEEVTARDKDVDDFYNSIFRTSITYMMENPRNISESAHLLFIAKNLERAGDHATNVAEMVYYAATGRYMEEREKGMDVTQAS
ncbi:MAG: phosphate signaling complex protein PhoU [Sphingopyxis sp.]|nr:phosphate signaling complex protein PhoU [Sphingopyxis sp.]